MDNKNQIMVLNDLIKINNDRIEGYRKASDNFKDNNTELLSLFNKYAADSQENKVELTYQIRRLNGTPDEGTTVSGKIYRAWMDVKGTLGGDDAKSILESCEGGEDAAKKAYQTALESGYLDMQSQAKVLDQQQNQLLSHNKIKSLRDQFQS